VVKAINKRCSKDFQASGILIVVHQAGNVLVFSNKTLRSGCIILSPLKSVSVLMLYIEIYINYFS
jgi:hypothetical protein